MQELMERPHSLVENFTKVETLLKTYGSDELHARRTRALREFENAGIPSPRHEEWKYTSLRMLQEGHWAPAYGSNVYREEIEGTLGGGLDGLVLAFVNGEAAPELCSYAAPPPGVIVCTIQDALAEHPDIVYRHLGRYAANSQGKLGANLDEPFAQLNFAYLGEGAFIYIPKGATVEETIHLLFVSKADHGPFVAHPRVLIVAEEGSVAKVVETYVGLDGTYFTNAVTEVYVGPNANLEHTKVQDETESAVHIATHQTHQEAGSVYTGNNVAYGGRLARNDVNVWLNGEHTESWLNGVYVGAGEQVLDNHTRIDHRMPNCNSFEVYKGVLSDRSTGVFNGKIFVYEDAQKTDAKQTNQALLLSPTAAINTKPQLEIFADDVKCTHGATVGQLREDAMFYLRSRGIPQRDAEALLVYAFAAEVLEKITADGVADALEKALFEKLNDGRDMPMNPTE